jgi:hypothetical protein
LGRDKSKQWSKTLVVFTVFDATQFQVFAKILPEPVIILQQIADMQVMETIMERYSLQFAEDG